MAVVWKVFDLMPNISKASYSEELIEIYNYVLLSLKSIDSSDFCQFLPQYEDYHRVNNQLGNIFYTYDILISKGYSFLKTEDGRPFVDMIANNTWMCVDMRFIEPSYHAVILLQYILAFFPNASIDHRQVFEVTQQIVRERAEDFDDEKLIAFINLWIIGSSISPVYELSELSSLHLEGIYGYNAKVFTLSINIKVQSLIN